VRRIAEVDSTETAVELEWDTWPMPLHPGDAVEVTAPSAGFDGKLWLMRIDSEFGPNGFRSRLTGWAGGSAPFGSDAAATDPDPAETPILPTDPRPVNEWRAIRPSAETNDD
jgi:hypothetical protein